ncbi:MAG TPA: tagaturonate epimerase family protein [Anaerohalosphaeraceae bacterium]|nr:tagaturonate epimerase family protein [Anaerohalosphaeraceae bacterium]HOL89510.1 tagaturonate epimerase family protein [Anaerohalosphaeraceae bacterium]HPP57100.1 tagaturonate epimerase family protein [Anaerohalosphaeraceae bacterium]
MTDKRLEKFSMGIGDRFGHQGRAQLRAMQAARAEGIEIVPVWNKSFREHSIIGTRPADVRAEADAAVSAMGWKHSYYVDADHINFKNVESFIDCSDFFTLDVAEEIGHPAESKEMEAFVRSCRDFLGTLTIPGIERPFVISEKTLEAAAAKYLFAVQQAGRIYRHLAGKKGTGTFITEVSMDETDSPQTPVELLLILSAIAREGIPAQTIAPKFTGRFNKGVDYVGNLEQFEKEFNEDLAVIAFAVKEFGLPGNLKLSVHSGSDKFSIYGPIRRAIHRFGAGLHLKTAGTTWLEELIGLAEAGGEGLAIAKEVYAKALENRQALCAPYATVIDIDAAQLPAPKVVDQWDGKRFAAALRHNPRCPDYNPHFRQLLHVGYKVAAQMGRRFTDALERFEEEIAKHVSANLLERHIRPVFGKGA